MLSKNRTKRWNKKIGRWGEERAASYLRKRGMEILEMNYRTRYGEIDIVAQDEGVLVFVEVKTKTGLSFGTPEEMVGRRKIRQICNTSLYYDMESDRERRIDVVAILLNLSKKICRIRYFKNVFDGSVY